MSLCSNPRKQNIYLYLYILKIGILNFIVKPNLFQYFHINMCEKIEIKSIKATHIVEVYKYASIS